MKKILLYFPVFIFLILVFFLLIFLLQEKDLNKPPSPLINQKLPNFVAIDLFDKSKKFTHKDFKEKQVLINFFASWCIPCKAEHPMLNYLKKNNPKLIIVGIDHKDKNEDAIKFLKINGNPYNYVGVDDKGNIGLDFGVFGLPETYLTNEEGVIIYKNIGPITKEIIKNEINPLLQ